MAFSRLILISILLFLFIPTAHAIYEPLSVQNNKFGIHIAELSDLKDVAALVNSTNGDWGYVTLVIQDTDRNQGKWQELFNVMRRLHLIPILRLATHPEGDSWKIPQKEDADRWASFLNSLNWPIENRYIILFNEPNHSKEWGKTINPEEYAEISIEYANAFKAKSSDFFILPAGFDTSASTDGEAQDAAVYIKRIYESNPQFFDHIDGWTSHSYPNPGFSGSPFGTGKGSIASFLWEMQFLKTLGITKEYPIFITETGWTHNQGKYSKGKLNPTDVANNLTIASHGIWSNQNIVAITPFLLNYQGAPFDHFSWKKMNSPEFFPHYYEYQKINKTKGQPNQKETFILKAPLFPEKLVMNSTYFFEQEVTNTGEGIVDPKDGYELVVRNTPADVSFVSDPLPYIEPTEKGTIRLQIKTPKQEGKIHITVGIAHNQTFIPLEEKNIILVPPPTITLSAQLGWKKSNEAKNTTVLIYDEQDQLLHKFQNLTITNGTTSITGLYNMIPGKTYRIVLIVPFYLPRQQLMKLNSEGTSITMKRLYPVDFNNDGTLNLHDIPALLFTKPNQVFSRFF